MSVESDRDHRREELAGLFWPELSENAARANLRRTLANLRDVLGDREANPPYLQISRQTIRFNLDSDHHLDTAELDAALTYAGHNSGTKQLETAVRAYQGDFLAGFAIADSAAFEQWLITNRTHYRQQALSALDQLVNRYETRGDHNAAIQAAQQQLLIDPCREEAHRQLMRLLVLVGDRNGALTQYQSCQDILWSELAVEPDQATQRLFEQIRDGQLEDTAAASWRESLRGYELRERIGSGAFGIVYRAYQPVVDRQVAVKVIRPELANQPVFIRRFDAEAHLVARLDHLNIVPLYDYWRDPAGAFLVMRWLRGGNLHQALQDGPWPLERVSRMLDQIAGALSFAHEHGVVHGDVRAENILLDEDGNAFLSDFGIARDVVGPATEALPDTDTVSGSILTLSPEQVLGSPATPLSDLYCLGLVVYQALVGRSPLEGKSPDQQRDLVVEDLLPPLTASRPGLSPAISAVLARATANDPAQRFAAVTELADAFREAVSVRAAEPIVREVMNGPLRNPYKGLSAFSEFDNRDFFGRDALVEQLIARLQETGPSHRLLAVVGPSGSGKSSVVLAGLLPALRCGALPGSDQWFVVTMIPGANPLRELGLALRQVAVDWPANAEAWLRDREDGLLELVATCWPDTGQQIVIVMDQLEELYTQAADPAEADQFLRLLNAAVHADDSSVRVILTLRADFYDRPLLHPDFSRPLRERTEIILPMTNPELLAAISQPAQQAGGHIAPDVAAAIIEEVSQQPGALPGLQYALTEMFATANNGQVDWAVYEAIGGVSGAVAQRAETVYRQLDVAGQETARQLFLRLVTLGGDGDGGAPAATRRRVLLSELETLDNDQPSENEEATTIDTVLDAFGGHRLLTFDRDLDTRAPTVELAHEALLEEWPRLAEWLNESRDDIRLQQRLSTAAAEWQATGQPVGLLASGMHLAQYETLLNGASLALTAEEQAFVRASQASRGERMERERRQRLLVRRLGIGATIAAVVAIILAALAWQSRSTAVRQAEVNHSLVLASAAQEIAAQGETDRALAVALAAVDIDEPPPEAIADLANVAYGPGTRARLLGHSAAVRTVALSPDGQAALSGSCATTDATDSCRAGELIRWDLANREEVARWTAHSGWVTASAWDPTGTWLTTGGADGVLAFWSTEDNTPGPHIEAHEGPISAIVFSPDGALAASASADGTLALVDVASGALLHRLEGHDGAVLDVAFSPDGETLASGGADSTVILWDAQTGMLLQTLEGHRSYIFGVAFVEDGASLLSGSNDLSFRLWDVASGEVKRVRESGDKAGGMAVSADGRTVAHYVDFLTYVWDVTSWDDPHRRLYGHQDFIHDMDISADGALALSAGNDGSVLVWELSSSAGVQQIPLGYSATGVGVTPDGQTLLSSGWSDTVDVRDATTFEIVRSLSGQVGVAAPGALAVSPDGRYVAVGSGEFDEDTAEGSLLVWEIASGDLTCDLKGHGNRLRSVAFGPDSNILLAGAQGDSDIHKTILWDVSACSQLQLMDGDDDAAGMAVSRDGRMGLVSSAFFERMTLWNLTTGEAIRIFPAPGEVLLDAGFGPDDATVLASALSGVIFEWDRETGELIRRYGGHSGGVWSVELSHNQQWLLSTDDTGEVILWDVNTGNPLRRHQAHDGLSFQAVFSPDDTTVYSVSADETLGVWQIGTPTLDNLLAWIDENRVVRDLTCEERQQYHVEPYCEAMTDPTN